LGAIGLSGKTRYIARESSRKFQGFVCEAWWCKFKQQLITKLSCRLEFGKRLQGSQQAMAFSSSLVGRLHMTSNNTSTSTAPNTSPSPPFDETLLQIFLFWKAISSPLYADHGLHPERLDSPEGGRYRIQSLRDLLQTKHQLSCHARE
jgi:hypothetical protein